MIIVGIDDHDHGPLPADDCLPGKNLNCDQTYSCVHIIDFNNDSDFNHHYTLL